MIEQTSDLPVVASVSWRCDECDTRGELHLARSCDVLGLAARLKTLHREASPACAHAVKGRGPSHMAQIATPEGAVVNDPREKRLIIGDSPKTAGLLGALMAAAAIASPQERDDHIRQHQHAAQPASPYSPEARRSAREEARARGARARMEAAEAKRARRADRRRGEL